MRTQAQTQAQTHRGRGQRARLVQRPPLEQEILTLIASVDKHLPEKNRDNDHYVAATRAAVKERCLVTDVDTNVVQLILTLRLLRDGDVLVSPAYWPEGTQAKAAQFFEQYPPVTIH